MTHKKAEIIKVNNILKKDRTYLNEEIDNLVLHDLVTVLGEYFELNGLPEYSVEKDKGKLFINLTFTALSVKRFRTIK